MSLSEVVVEIATEIEEAAGLEAEESVSAMMKSWAKQLKRVVKAAGSQTKTQPELGGVPNYFIGPGITKPQPTTAAAKLIKKKLQEQGELLERAVSGGNKTVLLIDGSSDGDTLEFPADAPVGFRAVMPWSGEVYFMGEDGNLHFSASETVKEHEKRTAKKSGLIIPPE